MITGEVNIIADLGTKFIKIATLWTDQSSFRIFCSQEISSECENFSSSQIQTMRFWILKVLLKLSLKEL